MHHDGDSPDPAPSPRPASADLRRDRIVIAIPFELEDREAAHRAADALAAEYARRERQRQR